MHITHSTGPEIWNQTNGQITHLVACSGTGGTISGTAKFLKEQNPNIQNLGIDAYGSVIQNTTKPGNLIRKEIYPYRIEVGKNLIPSATDFDTIDRFIKVTDEDSAHTTRELAKKEGLFVGYTSGAAMQASSSFLKKAFLMKTVWWWLSFQTMVPATWVRCSVTNGCNNKASWIPKRKPTKRSIHQVKYTPIIQTVACRNGFYVHFFLSKRILLWCWNNYFCRRMLNHCCWWDLFDKIYKDKGPLGKWAEQTEGYFVFPNYKERFPTEWNSKVRM